MDGTAPANTTVEIYSTTNTDSHGEGSQYLGTASVDATGVFSNTLSLTAPLSISDSLTAIAIDFTTGNTSEFAQNVTPELAPSGTDDAFSIAEDTSLSVAGWAMPGWQFRRQIQIDNSASSEDFSDFAILVQLDASNFDYSKAQSDGADLRFTDAADSQMLSYEIEDWDPSGTSIVWVRIPQLNAGTNNSINLYYGNSAAAPGEASGDVWGSEYDAVWHLNDTAGTSGEPIEESTNNNYDGINENADSTQGVVAGALAFDGNDYIDLGSNRDYVRNTREVTGSAWINTNDVNARQTVVETSGSGTTRSRFEIWIDGGEIHVRAASVDGSGSPFSTSTSGSNISSNTWHHIAATVDYPSETVAIYVDGVAQSVSTSGFLLLNSSPDNPADSGRIGQNQEGDDEFFDGEIDEVRISRDLKSADWIAAQYASMIGSSVSVQSEEVNSGITSNDQSSTGLTTANLVSAPSSSATGSFSFNPDGSFDFVPATDFHGVVNFTYELESEFGLTSPPISVTIDVTPVNDAPMTTDDSYVTREDVAIVISVADVCCQ